MRSATKTNSPSPTPRKEAEGLIHESPSKHSLSQVFDLMSPVCSNSSNSEASGQEYQQRIPITLRSSSKKRVLSEASTSEGGFYSEACDDGREHYQARLLEKAWVVLKTLSKNSQALLVSSIKKEFRKRGRNVSPSPLAGFDLKTNSTTKEWLKTQLNEIQATTRQMDFSEERLKSIEMKMLAKRVEDATREKLEVEFSKAVDGLLLQHEDEISRLEREAKKREILLKCVIGYQRLALSLEVRRREAILTQAEEIQGVADSVQQAVDAQAEQLKFLFADLDYAAEESERLTKASEELEKDLADARNLKEQVKTEGIEEVIHQGFTENKALRQEVAQLKESLSMIEKQYEETKQFAQDQEIELIDVQERYDYLRQEFYESLHQFEIQRSNFEVNFKKAMFRLKKEEAGSLELKMRTMSKEQELKTQVKNLKNEVDDLQKTVDTQKLEHEVDLELTEDNFQRSLQIRDQDSQAFAQEAEEAHHKAVTEAKFQASQMKAHLEEQLLEQSMEVKSLLDKVLERDKRIEELQATRVIQDCRIRELERGKADNKLAKQKQRDLAALQAELAEKEAALKQEKKNFEAEQARKLEESEKKISDQQAEMNAQLKLKLEAEEKRMADRQRFAEQSYIKLRHDQTLLNLAQKEVHEMRKATIKTRKEQQQQVLAVMKEIADEKDKNKKLEAQVAELSNRWFF